MIRFVTILLATLFSFSLSYINEPYNIRFAVGLEDSNGISISWTTKYSYQYNPVF